MTKHCNSEKFKPKFQRERDFNSKLYLDGLKYAKLARKRHMN